MTRCWAEIRADPTKYWTQGGGGKREMREGEEIGIEKGRYSEGWRKRVRKKVCVRTKKVEKRGESDSK